MILEVGLAFFAYYCLVKPAFAALEGIAEAKRECDLKYAKARIDRIHKIESMQMNFDKSHSFLKTIYKDIDSKQVPATKETNKVLSGIKVRRKDKC